mgnify:CR=1 FL=1
MATNHNPTNTNNERTGYAEGYTRALNESFCPQASTFLRSRKQSITIDWDMGADHGGTPARIKETITYARKAFADAVRALLPTVLSHGTMSGYAGTDPADIGERALSDIVSTVNGRSKQGYTTFAAQVAIVRRTAQKSAKSAKNEAELKVARKAGNVFTDNEGKEWVSREKAVKSTARNMFGQEWWKTNKAEHLRQADEATPGGQSAPAPVAKQSSVSTKTKAELLAQAQGIGVTGTSKMNKGQLESAIQERLSALGL